MYLNLKSIYQYHFCVKSKPCVLSHTKIDTKHMSNKHYVVVVILIELQNDKRKEKARNWLYGRCCFVGPHEGEQQYVLWIKDWHSRFSFQFKVLDDVEVNIVSRVLLDLTKGWDSTLHINFRSKIAYLYLQSNWL